MKDDNAGTKGFTDEILEECGLAVGEILDRNGHKNAAFFVLLWNGTHASHLSTFNPEELVSSLDQYLTVCLKAHPEGREIIRRQ